MWCQKSELTNLNPSRIFTIIMKAFILLDKARSPGQLPHHVKNALVAEVKFFLCYIQAYDDVIIGIGNFSFVVDLQSCSSGSLSELILHSLRSLGVTQLYCLDSKTLSPSFYQPGSLAPFSKFSSINLSVEFRWLLSQLNHFESWVQIPALEETCMEYLASTDNKTDLII